MKVLVTALFVFVSIKAIGCVCAPFEKKDVPRLIEEADYVIIGTPEQFLHWDLETRDHLNEITRGTGVKLRVDSVLKGNLNKDYIYVNQFSNGNCVKWFELGSRYIIMGYRIKKFIDARPKEMREQNSDEIPITIQPPPAPTELKNRKMECYSESTTSIQYWNNIAKDGTIIHTSQCSAFHIGSVVGGWFRS